MSKIQKAIQAMRGKGNTQAEKFVAQHGPNDTPKANGNSVISRPTVERRSLASSFDGFHEQQIVCRIELDKEILRRSGLILNDNHADIVEEQFRRAKRPLLQIAFEMGIPADEHANVVMVASAMPGAGKSFCSFNLARSISRERDVGVVLVDADVLKPGLSAGMGLDNKPGLIDYLLDKDMALDDIILETDLDGIAVVPAGRRHGDATELLASRRMQLLVSELSDRFRSRVIIFDTPPLLVTNEAHVLACHVGQIVFIIEAQESSQESVLQALGSLDRNMPINAILNKSRSANIDGYYGDDYGYYPFHGGRGDDTERKQ